MVAYQSKKRRTLHTVRELLSRSTTHTCSAHFFLHYLLWQRLWTKETAEHSIALRKRTTLHSVHQYREWSANIRKGDAWIVLSISRSAFVCECVSGVSIIPHSLLLYKHTHTAFDWQPNRLPSKSIECIKKNSCEKEFFYIHNIFRLIVLIVALSLHLEQSNYSFARIVYCSQPLSCDDFLFSSAVGICFRTFSPLVCVYRFHSFIFHATTASHLESNEGTKMQPPRCCECRCEDTSQMYVLHIKSAYMLSS